jgi:hypothetical protein
MQLDIWSAFRLLKTVLKGMLTEVLGLCKFCPHKVQFVPDTLIKFERHGLIGSLHAAYPGSPEAGCASLVV